MRQIDSDVEFSPIYRNSIHSSLTSGDSVKVVAARHSSTASEALSEFVAPLLEENEGGIEGAERGGLEARGEVSPTAKEERERQSLVLLVSSNDRLEVTLSPGALETLLKIVEVGTTVEIDCQ